MKNAITATQQEFQSSSGKTPEYLAWHKLFKKEFTALLKKFGAKTIEISKPNHFDLTGFFQMESGQIWYISVGDVRWSKSEMLIRTAQSFKDYTGGHNQYVTLTDVELFVEGLHRLINNRPLLQMA